MTAPRLSRPRVVVLGGLNMDLIIETPRLAGPGETAEGTRFWTTPGGKGGNQAVAAARVAAGAASVEMVARVGDDPFGTEMVGYLKAASVGTRFVRRDPGAASGIAAIFIDGRGENYVNAVYGANARCDARQVADCSAALAGARLLLLQQEVPLVVNLAAMEQARAAGVMVILDPAPARPLPEGYLARADIATPNQTEAEAMTGVHVDGPATAGEAGRALRRLGVPTAIVTLGEAGAWVESEGLSAHFPAFRVPIVATVGAGDAFNGGLAAGLATGASLEVAVRLALATGSLAVTRAGAQAAMPTRAEVDALLAGTWSLANGR